MVIIRSGEKRKEIGMNRALRAERIQEWRPKAKSALEELADSGRQFTAEDLEAMVGLPDVGSNKNNAVGALFGAASRSGLIEYVGTTKASRATSNARRISVWKGAAS